MYMTLQTNSQCLGYWIFKSCLNWSQERDDDLSAKVTSLAGQLDPLLNLKCFQVNSQLVMS